MKPQYPIRAEMEKLKAMWDQNESQTETERNQTMKSWDNQLKAMRDETAAARHSPEAEALADAILKAAGSGLHHYSMEKTRQAIFAAAEEGIDSARAELLEALDHLCWMIGLERLRPETQHALRNAQAIIAKVHGGHYPVENGWAPTTESNARNIAHRYNTQPALLEALELVFEDNKNGCVADDWRIAKGRAAIAKARGESEAA